MSQPAIIVEGISKRYRLGHQASPHQTFREMATGMLTAPFRKLRAAGEAGNEGEEFWALKDVSFEVQPGEVVGIIGRNGAGKSTLLKILSRITEPTTGQIRLRGRVASLLEVGTGFHPELTGRENIYLNGAILGMKRAEITKKFDEIVAFAETEKFLDTPVKFYSSGMYVRLAFAVAAHLEPEILIVDEVLAVGDAEFQKKCLGKMQDVSKTDGRTVLFVSHNMAAVRSLCSTAYMFERGQIVRSGSSEECVEYYMAGGSTSTGQATYHFERPANVPQWVTGAHIFVNGKSSSTVHMGDDLAIAIDFACVTLMEKPRLGFTLYSSDGTCLINTNNRFQRSSSFSRPVSAGTIICQFGKLPLVGGRYYLTIWFGDSAGDSHVLDKAVCVDMIEKDIWGSGRCPPSKDSYLWWPARFTLHENTEADNSKLIFDEILSV